MIPQQHRVMVTRGRVVGQFWLDSQQSSRSRSMLLVRSSSFTSGLAGLRRTHHPPCSTAAVRSFLRSISSRVDENATSSIQQQQQQTRSSSDRSASGLFAIPELQTPQDFSVLTKQAIQECNQLRSSVSATVRRCNTEESVVLLTRPETRQLLHQLDDISKSVCNVIDAAELCRNVHANPVWREAADMAFAQLSDYMTLLNADTTLYRALQLVNVTNTASTTNNTNHAFLSEVDERFAMLLQSEFKRDGIHLSDAKRDQVRDYQNQIVQLGSTFYEF